MRWNQTFQDDHDDVCGWGESDADGQAAEAWIARGRMKEMQAKGWRALGPIREDAVWMRGPDLDAAAQPEAWKPLAAPAVAAQRLRLRAAAAVALRRPHGRRVA